MLNIRHLLLILSIFTIAENTQATHTEVPYIYNNGPKELDLFLSFNCYYCRAALEILAKYLKTKPPVRARIYFFVQNPGDKARLIWLIATENNLDAFLELHSIFLTTRNQKDKLIAFLKKHPQIKNNITNHTKLYSSIAESMQSKFLKKRIDCTPTWLIDDNAVINGVVEQIDQLINSV